MSSVSDKRRKYEQLKEDIEKAKEKKTRLDIGVENKKKEYEEQTELLKSEFNIEFKSIGELKEIKEESSERLDTLLDELESKLN